MTTDGIRTMLISLRTQENAAVVNGRLGALDLKTDAENDNAIKIGIVKWLKAKFPTMSKEEILNLIEQKGGFSALTKAYLVTSIQDELKQIEAERQAAIEQAELDKFFQEQDSQKQELEAQAREQERLAREKERADELLMIEAAKKLTKGLQVKAGQPADRASLALGAKVFEKLPDELLPEFMKYLKDNLGFELKGRDHGDILRDGREITEETVTREDLENGDIKLVISMDKLKSPEYARLLQEEQRTLDARETRVHEEAANDQRAQDTGETLTVEVNEGPEMD